MQAQRAHTVRAYALQHASRALTPTGGFLHGFAFSLNPYIGCAFGAGNGCPFCYVRALPVARTAGGPWGSWVFAKANLPELLERELIGLESRGRLDAAAVFMSSATDPYQGLERRLRITERALSVLARHPPHRVVVQTRSPLIERDITLLRAMGSRVIASITLETDDERVRRALTPTSPSVPRRLRSAQRLRDAGIFTQIVIAPMMPNNPRRFAELVEGAADRVVVDTYFDGDGSSGRRSQALGIGQLYRRHGYEDWFLPGAEKELLTVLRERLGTGRVLFSRDGFNAV